MNCPDAARIAGEPVRSTPETFYIEWNENGRQVQRSVGTSAREAKDAWNRQPGLDAGPETEHE